MEKTLINFTEINVDGCGSNATALIEVLGAQKVPKQIVTEIIKEIHRYLEVNNSWDTDDVINAGCAILENFGYTYNMISFDYDIQF